MSTSNVPHPAPKSKANGSVTVIPKSRQAILTDALEQLNKEIVYIKQTREIAEINPDPGIYSIRVMSTSDFKNSDYCDRFIELGATRIYLAKAWMNWPGRRKVNRLVYEPNEGRFTSTGDLNTYFPSPNLPIKGDLTLYFKYRDHIFAHEPTFKNWFEAWLAYPLQHPGHKLNSAVVFWSQQTGTGKSTLAYIMKEIYGQHNCSLLTVADFHATYNGWAVNKCMVEVDEMPADSQARRRAELLKSLTTRKTIPVDLKYQNRYEIRDTINYFYTSNHLASLYLNEFDRRFFIHNLGNEKLPEAFFAKEFNPWLQREGFSAIHYYLKYEIDLSKPIVGGNPYDPNDLKPFSPGQDAPHSKSRREAIEAGYDDVEGWIKDLIDCPFAVLPEDETRTIFTADELYKFFDDRYPKLRIGPKAFARKLNEQGLQLNAGDQVRIGDQKFRLYLINKIETKHLPRLRQKVSLEEIRKIWSQERGELSQSESKIETDLNPDDSTG